MEKLPINERPREKAFLYGIETLTNADLIAILICTGNKKLDALELANLLINDLGSLKNLDSLSLQELSEYNGIKEAKALKIKAALELHHRIEKEKISSIRKINSLIEAANFLFNQTYNRTIESLQVLLLDQENNIVSTKIMSVGTNTSVSFSPSEIVNFALKNKAKKIIIAHNHPSNNLLPSDCDKKNTEALNLLTSVLDIEFIDHLILGKNEFYSFAQNALSKYKFN